MNGIEMAEFMASNAHHIRRLDAQSIEYGTDKSLTVCTGERHYIMVTGDSVNGYNVESSVKGLSSEGLRALSHAVFLAMRSVEL